MAKKPATPVETDAGIAWAELLGYVAARHRARAQELALYLHGDYAAAEAIAARNGHRQGFTEGQKAAEEANPDGYKDGWNSGYAAGIKAVMGHAGGPAQPPFDGDSSSTPSEPPSS